MFLNLLWDINSQPSTRQNLLTFYGKVIPNLLWYVFQTFYFFSTFYGTAFQNLLWGSISELSMGQYFSTFYGVAFLMFYWTVYLSNFYGIVFLNVLGIFFSQFNTMVFLNLLFYAIWYCKSQSFEGRNLSTFYRIIVLNLLCYSSLLWNISSQPSMGQYF